MRVHPNKDKKVVVSNGSTGLLKEIFNYVRSTLSGGLRTVMQTHSMMCMSIGLGTLFLPHRFYSSLSGYNHFAHEFIRLYGCLSLGIGYLVWMTKDVKDGRLLRALTETFAISYGLQAVAMLRAQLTNPEGHSYFHWYILLQFTFISGLYAYCRLSKKMKDFELPGFDRGE